MSLSFSQFQNIYIIFSYSYFCSLDILHCKHYKRDVHSMRYICRTLNEAIQIFIQHSTLMLSTLCLSIVLNAVSIVVLLSKHAEITTICFSYPLLSRMHDGYKLNTGFQFLYDTWCTIFLAAVWRLFRGFYLLYRCSSAMRNFMCEIM